jgi:hypothetical protein
LPAAITPNAPRSPKATAAANALPVVRPMVRKPASIIEDT